MLSLFSGVGMIDLAASWAGIETVAMCEIERYPQKILKKLYPEVKIYDDIFKLTAERIRNDGIGKIDIIAGGFPCQPFSVAGNQKGEEDKRHLWPEMCRLIREIKPKWVLGENVPGLMSITDVSGRKGGTFGNILKELAEMGYDAIWSVYGANEIGAPHKRERVFVLAYSCSQRWSTRGGDWQRRYFSNDKERNATQSKSEWNGRQCGASKVNKVNGVNWPTPKAALRGDCPSERKRHTPCLDSAVKLYPTPTRSDVESWSYNETKQSGKCLEALARTGKIAEKKGQLNPDWVETLMGLPIGWTNIDCENPKPFPGWPAVMGQEQYDYEPPRVATDIPNRANRLKAIGNGCVPEQVYPIFKAISYVEKLSVERKNKKNKTSF